MTREEIDLLFTDLCGRIPYGVKVQFEGWDEETEDYIDVINTLYSVNSDKWVNVLETDSEIFIEGVKPFLFPMSVLTNEQAGELLDMDIQVGLENLDKPHNLNNLFVSEKIQMDWLNKHHFDHRGLIEKGLAIDATGKNIYS